MDTDTLTHPRAVGDDLEDACWIHVDSADGSGFDFMEGRVEVQLGV